MTYTAPTTEEIAAYRIDTEYRFGVTLRRNGVERCAEVTCDSPLFTNVCQAVREQHPGWSVWESWEIAAPQPATDDDGPTLEQLFAQYEEICQRPSVA